MADQRIAHELQSLQNPRGVFQDMAATSNNSSSEKSFWDVHDSAIAASNARKVGGGNKAANRIVVMSSYIDLPYVSRQIDPLNWWKDKQTDSVLKLFVPLVKQFLSIPATSVPCEHMFSKAGELVSAKRSMLSPKNVDMILFLNKNY